MEGTGWGSVMDFFVVLYFVPIRLYCNNDDATDFDYINGNLANAFFYLLIAKFRFILCPSLIILLISLARYCPKFDL